MAPAWWRYVIAQATRYVLFGEDDNDDIFGGDGNDGGSFQGLFGETGADELQGQAGDDDLDGGAGTGDVCTGGRVQTSLRTARR